MTSDVSRLQLGDVRVKVLLTTPVPLAVQDYMPDECRLMLAEDPGDGREFGQAFLGTLFSEDLAGQAVV